MREIKIKNKDFPDGQWVKIAYENEWAIYEDVYHFVDSDFDMDNIKVGEIIELDDEFEVVELGKHDYPVSLETIHAIENFIIRWTSDEEERQKMREVAEEVMKEDALNG